MPDFVDPFRAYHFKLEIKGVTEGHFTECEGLGVKIEVIKYREAGERQIVHNLPGRVDYSKVTLRYGLTASQELWNWLQDAIAGKVEPQNVSIVMLDHEGAEEALRWNLQKAWPCEWQGAVLDSMASRVAIENLVLAYEGVERTQRGGA